MIVIKIVEGPHAGKMREIVEGRYEGHIIDPAALLMQLMNLGSRWQINYSGAHRNEAIEWGRADLTVRYLRALMEGRTVFFMGTEYQAIVEHDVRSVAQAIEDTIATSGYDVTLEFDDERGVFISAVSPTNSVQ